MNKQSQKSTTNPTVSPKVDQQVLCCGEGGAYASLLEGTAQFGLVQLSTPVSVDGTEPR